MQSASFIQTQTIVRALEFALAKGGFRNNGRQKRAAAALIKEMKSNQSVSGRYQQIVALLGKGATIDQMMKSAGSSRRTIFRYLNHFEDAGLNIIIKNGRYWLQGGS